VRALALSVLLAAPSAFAAKAASIRWVRIPGGTFIMGSDSGPARSRPAHRVTVRTFELSKTLVTVAQYEDCVAAGACVMPKTKFARPSTNGGEPMVGADWFMARTFARWAHARLPSEAEWEYAARGPQDRTYPWGNEPPTCARAVYEEMPGAKGCGRNAPWPVCSKPEGNTPQGLCDMAGDVLEWVEDAYHPSYEGAPSDGSAWEGPAGSERVARGGFFFGGEKWLAAWQRVHGDPGDRVYNGIRLARSVR
jgi:eukaryotic-like serine/threonine-protein kinase